MDYEEIYIYRTGSIRKMDGALSKHKVASLDMEANPHGGVIIRFADPDGNDVPIIVYVMVAGKVGEEVRDSVFKSLTHHLHRGVQ